MQKLYMLFLWKNTHELIEKGNCCVKLKLYYFLFKMGFEYLDRPLKSKYAKNIVDIPVRLSLIPFIGYILYFILLCIELYFVYY